MKTITKRPITSHNKYPQTDKLYEPLRAAIKRANNIKQSKISSSNFQNSLVSRKMHQLSPQEIYYIEHQVMIPTDCKLKPSNDYSKLQNKTFVVVDINEKYNGTLTENQISDITSRPRVVEQKIYEYCSKNTSKQNSTKHSPLISNYQMNELSLKSKYEKSFDDFYQESDLQKQPNQSTCLHNQSLISNKQKLNKLKRASSQEYFPNLHKIHISEPKQSQLYIQQREKPIKGKRYTYQPYNNKQISSSSSYQQYSQLSHANNQQYRFRSGTVASLGFQSQNETLQKEQKQKKIKNSNKCYKYNLFSSIDQGIDTGCASFGKNQLIARELHNRKWE